MHTPVVLPSILPLFAEFIWFPLGIW